VGSHFRVASVTGIDVPATHEPVGVAGRGAACSASADGDPDRAAAREIDRLYRSEAPALTRRMRRQSSVAEDALDVVHDAFVRLLGLGSGRIVALAAEKPGAYLNRTTRNLVMDRHKRDLHRSASTHYPADEAALAGPHPRTHLEARDELRRIETAMLKLRERPRAIYLAHRVEGLTYAEIAQRCGISVKGVEKHMTHAIAALDLLLDND
jgi:RNA polymerase sigma factor (sigma-70 family)